MQYSAISAGADFPNNFNVVVEIPVGGEPVKYELDKASGTLVVDRFLSTSMRYPGNYGFIPQTLGDDGDPLDVLIVADIPLVAGSVISCRPIGVLRMTDEAGQDEKLIAVPSRHVSKMFDGIEAITDINNHRLQQIAHFFENYKGLEVGKWVRLAGWGDVDEALLIVQVGLAKAQDESNLLSRNSDTHEQLRPNLAKILSANIHEIKELLTAATSDGVFNSTDHVSANQTDSFDDRYVDSRLVSRF